MSSTRRPFWRMTCKSRVPQKANEVLSGGPGEVGLSLITLVELRGRLTELTADLQEVDRVFKLYSETLTTRLPFTGLNPAPVELATTFVPRLWSTAG